MDLCKPRFAQVRRFCSVALAITFLGLPTALEATVLTQGSITIARPGPHALIIWNATRQLRSFEHTHLPHYQILEHIEAQSLDIISLEFPHLKNATFVSVRVEYERPYGNPSVAQLFTLTAPMQALQQRKHWSQTLLQGRLPHGVLINDSGPL